MIIGVPLYMEYGFNFECRNFHDSVDPVIREAIIVRIHTEHTFAVLKAFDRYPNHNQSIRRISTEQIKTNSKKLEKKLWKHSVQLHNNSGHKNS